MTLDRKETKHPRMYRLDGRAVGSVTTVRTGLPPVLSSWAASAADVTVDDVVGSSDRVNLS